jgi:uncharacterized protein (DUF736 family)
MNIQKPTFGGMDINPPSTKKRTELGAIWQKTSRDSSRGDYLNIKLSLTKEKLQQLLQAQVDDHGNVTVNLVAFKNDFYKEPKHPNYRIYEELKQELK